MKLSANIYLICGIVCGVHYATSSDCQTRSYNDVSKVFQAFEKGYLLYDTDVNNDFICNTVTRKSLAADNQGVVYEGSHRTTSNSTEQSFTQILRIAGCPEDYEMSYSSDPERILEGEVVYSDYKYCDINSDPSHETGCRLWILNDASPADIEGCVQNFHAYCGLTKRTVYNETVCGSPP